MPYTLGECHTNAIQLEEECHTYGILVVWHSGCMAFCMAFLFGQADIYRVEEINPGSEAEDEDSL